MAFDRPILNREIPDFTRDRFNFEFPWLDLINRSTAQAAATTPLTINVPIPVLPGLRYIVDECLVRIPSIYCDATANQAITGISFQLGKLCPEMFATATSATLNASRLGIFAHRTSLNATLITIGTPGLLIPVSQPLQLVGTTGPFGFDVNPGVPTTYYRPRTTSLYGANIPVAGGTVLTPTVLGVPIDPGTAGIAGPADQPLLSGDAGNPRATVGGRVFNICDNVMNPGDLLWGRITITAAGALASGNWGTNAFSGGTNLGNANLNGTPVLVSVRVRQRRS